MAKTISHLMLHPGELIFVRGKIGYCRITSLVDGDELKRNNENDIRNNRFPSDKPYYTITLRDAHVTPRVQGQPTIEDKYIEEHMYTTKANPNEMCYSRRDTNGRLPEVWQRDDKINPNETLPDGVKPQGNVTKINKLERELANGLDVTLILRVFESKQKMKGISFDSIIINEPIRYYRNSPLAERLREEGITVTDNEPETTVSNPVTTSQAPVPPTTAPQTQPNQQSQYGTPAPTGAMPEPVPPVGYNRANVGPSYDPAMPGTGATPDYGFKASPDANQNANTGAGGKQGITFNPNEGTY